MFMGNRKKEIFTIPNLLSLFRLVLIPVYVTIYLRAATPGEYILAGSILTLSCLTDVLDGMIARRFHMVSQVGKVLDPVADKATQFTLTLCLSVKHPELKPVLILLVLKESFQLIAMVVSFLHGKARPGALIPGKVCTAVLFSSLIALVLFPNLSNRLVKIIALLDSILLLFSFVSYVLAYLGKQSKLRDLPTE